MKKIIFLLFLCIVFVSPGYADINLGAETRVRGHIDNSTDFYDTTRGTFTTISSDAYFKQRTRLYLEGTVGSNVTLNTQLQAIGRWDETTDIFLETANIKFSKLTTIASNKFRLDITAGRQSIEYGNGLLVRDADSATGFNSLKADVFFKNDFKLDVFSILLPTSTVIGGMFSKVWKKDVIKQYIYTIYQNKGNDPTSPETGLFVGSRVEVDPREDVHYSVELAKEIGGDGIAGIAGANLSAKGKNINVLVEVLYGNMDFTLDTAWLNYHDYGEYFLSNAPTGFYDYKLRNLTILKLGITYNDIKNLVFGVNAFTYKNDGKNNFFDALILSADTYDAGIEYDIYATYKFSPNINFRFIYAIYYPGVLTQDALKITGSDDYARKILLECKARF